MICLRTRDNSLEQLQNNLMKAIIDYEKDNSTIEKHLRQDDYRYLIRDYILYNNRPINNR